MSMSDYVDGNYQSRTDIGNMYFYYKVDGKIYLVISKDSLYNDWNVKELTSSEIGVPEGSKIKWTLGTELKVQKVEIKQDNEIQK